MEKMQEFRAQLDALDKKITDLLIERFKVIRAVGHHKAKEGIATIQSARAEEVKNNAATRAEAGGLDGTLLRNIYTLIIDHAHVVEDEIREEYKGK